MSSPYISNYGGYGDYADDIASYGMGSTYGDSTQADAMSVEVSDHYKDPLSLSPSRVTAAQHNAKAANKPAPVQRETSASRVTFRNDQDPENPKNRKKNRFNRGNKKNKKRYNPSLPDSHGDESEKSAYWTCWTKFSSLLIPDCFICRPDAASKQAWREKLAIFQIFVISNMIFLFLFGAIPLFFCNPQFDFFADYEWYEDYDTTIEQTCDIFDYVIYVFIFIFAALLALQCICSLILGIQSFCFRIAEERPWKATDFKQPLMVMVPCYNEGEKELRKTIGSILESDYPAEHKFLVVVADGIVTGRGEYFNTPTVLSNILGFSLDKSDPAYSYKSLGGSGENRASVYSGVYEKGRDSLKYIVIVKRGTPEEKDSSRPGNRGKRDSQLVVLGLFNRIKQNRKRTDLDKALCSAMQGLDLNIYNVHHMLAIDADTRVSCSSLCHMMFHMLTHPKTLACCGETKVDNKASSWVSMIQVYEYFAAHHLKKSFESVFGCVTCLPGCFTMYRINDTDDRALLSADCIFQSYSRNDINSLHEKNLYHLGEDRMLTTYLLKFFPDMSLSFVPIASCWTIVPDEFKILLSQRRRWINSTFHNMWELLKVNTMCGFLCVSMNAIVLLDLFSTMVLPSALIYAGFYTYVAIANTDESDFGVDLITIILYGVLIGSQTIIFLLRSRLDYIFWFLIYLILGIPVFYFILPIYSFWHMDDFSWGTTRQVNKSKKAKSASAAAATPKQQPKQQQPKQQQQRAAAKPEQRREEKRLDKSLKEEYQHKMAAMGAGQQHAAWDSFDDDPPRYSNVAEPHRDGFSGKERKRKTTPSATIVDLDDSDPEAAMIFHKEEVYAFAEEERYADRLAEI